MSFINLGPLQLSEGHANISSRKKASSQCQTHAPQRKTIMIRTGHIKIAKEDLSLFHAALFSLRIGKDANELIAHESILNQSPVLRGLCHQAANSRIIVLPDDRPRPFACVLGFLQSHEFRFDISPEPAAAEIRDLAAIYILAHKYWIPGLKRWYTDKWRHCTDMDQLFTIARIVFDNVPEDDMTFRLMVQEKLQILVLKTIVDFNQTGGHGTMEEEIIEAAASKMDKLSFEIFLAQRNIIFLLDEDAKLNAVNKETYVERLRIWIRLREIGGDANGAAPD